jgi:hypothetical protein
LSYIFFLLKLGLGFVVSLYISAQLLVTILYAIPWAARLIKKEQMRAGVIWRILLTPLIWFVLLVVLGFILEGVWPAAIVFLTEDPAFGLGGTLGNAGDIV